jgi:hypothetical protein
MGLIGVILNRARIAGLTLRSEVIHTDDVATQVLQVSETEKPDLIVMDIPCVSLKIKHK